MITLQNIDFEQLESIQFGAMVPILLFLALFQAGQKSHPQGSELQKGQVRLFRRWPETQLRYVEEGT